MDEGAGILAAGLADALAETGANVLLVNDSGTLPGNALVGSEGHPDVQRLDAANSPRTPRQWRTWRSSAELSRYDHVVVDSGQVLDGDSPFAADAADTTILVARQGRTDRQLVQAARQSLTAIGALEVVAVLDDVDPRNVPRHEMLAGVSLAEDGRARRARAGA